MFVYDNISVLVTLLNIGLAGFVIFLERRNVASTWAWLMVLLFLPIVGFAAYIILGQNLSKRKMYKLERETEVRLAGVIEAQRSEFKERAMPFRDPVMNRYRDLMYMNLMSSSAFFTQNNDIRIFTDGREKFDSLLATIREAKESIHLLYYIVKDDALGNRLLDALIEKAEEGVEVRFLYDHIGSSSLSRKFFQRLTKAGGQAAAFFPSKIPYLNIRVNYRNHRKLVVVDGKYGYIGGFNVGDEYLGLDPRFGYWRDTHLRIEGSAVLQMQIQFMLDWNLASASKVTPDEKYFPPSGLQGQVGVQIVSSGPNFSVEHTRNLYLKMIHAAKECIYIQTPYFIPDESVLNALKMAVLSGVDVRVMIPGKPDKRMVYWASYSYLGDLLQLGMRCFLYDRGFLHAKTIVVDGEIASVGTANFDIRSFRLNFEVNAVLYDTATAGKLREIFAEDMDYCRELTYEEYHGRTRAEHFRESCIRLLSPIL
ncbi:MAG TPA: cardiolipin synthase [Paenibacillus sp.]|nr:cardiolipin synthase [Paenibacillus sp.]